MKVKKFIFKFVDHDKKLCTAVHVVIHGGKSSQWIHSEEDMEGYLKWLVVAAKWNFNLKQEVHNVIRNRYFADMANDKNKFGDYKLVKAKMVKEDNIINMNIAKDTNEVKMRETKSMDKHMMKFSRGKKPEEWTEMYNYKKEEHHHHFNLISESMTEQIKLREVSTFDVPDAGISDYTEQAGVKKQEMKNNSAQTNTQVLSQQNKQVILESTRDQNATQVLAQEDQQGGAYAKKYLMYKKKYLDLKNRNY